MKNIYEIMKEFGLEIPEEKRAEFDKAWKENYRTKAEYDKAVEQRDAHKASLDDVNERLKEFEGVDVADLKAQITKLQGDIKAKDDEYAVRETERVFNDTLAEAIKSAGGRSTKAIAALLNIDELKASKNQSEDIKKALDTVKESDAYLFGSDEPFLNPIGATGGNGGSDGNTNLSAIRAAMGLPEKK